MPYGDIRENHEQGTGSGSCPWITTFYGFVPLGTNRRVGQNEFMRYLKLILKVFVDNLKCRRLRVAESFDPVPSRMTGRNNSKESTLQLALLVQGRPTKMALLI